MWIEVALILVIICVLLVLASRVNKEGESGSLLEKMLPKFPKYHNRDRHTMGRLAGRKAIQRQNDGYCTIRYKTGWFGTRLDPDIPQWAVHRYDPPDTKTPEGVVEVEPFRENVKWATGKEKIISEMHHFENLNRLYLGMIKTLEHQILQGTNTTVIQDNMKNIASLVKETEKRIHGIKETAGETQILKFDERTAKKKPTVTG